MADDQPTEATLPRAERRRQAREAARPEYPAPVPYDPSRPNNRAERRHPTLQMILSAAKRRGNA